MGRLASSIFAADFERIINDSKIFVVLSLPGARHWNGAPPAMKLLGRDNFWWGRGDWAHRSAHEIDRVLPRCPPARKSRAWRRTGCTGPNRDNRGNSPRTIPGAIPS